MKVQSLGWVVVAVAWWLGHSLGSAWYRTPLDLYLALRLGDSMKPGAGVPPGRPDLEGMRRCRVLLVDASDSTRGGGAVVDRHVQAQIIRKLTQLKAWVIGLDLVHDSTSDREADEDLRSAIGQSGRVILASRYDPSTLQEVPSLFASVALDSGIAAFVIDPHDGFLRKVQHYYEETGIGSRHSLSITLARHLQRPPGQPPFPVRITDDALLLEVPQGGFLRAPIDSLGLSLIQYQGPHETTPILAWTDLLGLTVDDLDLTGKCVIVGHARLEGPDVWPIPYRRSALSLISGAEIHAQDLVGLLVQSRYRLAPSSWDAALGLVAALVANLVALRLGMMGSVAVLVVSGAILWILLVTCFALTGLAINPLVPLLSGGFAFMATGFLDHRAREALANTRVEFRTLPTPAQTVEPAVIRAIELLDQGRAVEALARLRALMPPDGWEIPPKVHWGLALALLSLRQPSMAITHLAALEGADLELNDLDRLGRVLEQRGAFPEAMSILERIVSRDPHYQDVACRLAELKLRERQVPGWLRQALADRYDQLALIGSGGMGRVYKARDLLADREVAIKVPDESLLADHGARNRFLREVEVLGRLDHPHIVRVLEVHVGEPAYYTMELISGASMREQMEPGHPMKTDDVVRIGSQIASALEAIHREGIVHRDLKPDNVLLDERGVARLADFGLAFIDNNTRMTRTGSTLGTPLYMAPDQLQGLEPTPSWDLYSLGVLLFEALHGEPPFPSSKIVSKLVTDPPSLDTVRPGLPADLVDLVGRCLSRDPQHRLADAGSAKAILERFRQSGWKPGRED